MLGVLAICSAAICGSTVQPKQIDGWPIVSKPDLPNTVLVVHEVKGAAFLVRKGVTYKITSFEAKSRQSKKLQPLRLVVLDQDQFWLGEASTARISYPGVERSAKNRLVVFGKDEREKGRTYVKNQAPLPPAAISSLRFLVRLGQNSKPLTATSEPQIILPHRNELVPTGGFKSLYWPSGPKDWKRISIVYPLSNGTLPISAFGPGQLGRVSAPRPLVLSRLAEYFGSAEDWKSKSIGLRLIAETGSGRSIYQDFYLASPEQDTKIASLLKDLDGCLRSKPSLERDLELSDLCGQLGDSPSVMIEALTKHKNDPAAASALEVICEELDIPVGLVGLP